MRRGKIRSRIGRVLWGEVNNVPQQEILMGINQGPRVLVPMFPGGEPPQRPCTPLEPPPISQESRTYYIEVYGFDPVTRRAQVEPGRYRYEEFLQLPNDPLLARAGVTMGARVEFTANPQEITNRIVFMREGQEASVSCVHTAVCTLAADSALNKDQEKFVELAQSTEVRIVSLPPEEHFVSLRSYVAGLAGMGLRNVMVVSYHSDAINPEVLPFGFNAALQKQVAEALRSIAPEATTALVRDLLAELPECVPSDWLAARLNLLDEIYHIRDVLFSEPDLFECMARVIPLSALRALARQHTIHMHPAIAEQIKPHREVKYRWIQRGDDEYMFKIVLVGFKRSNKTPLKQWFMDSVFDNQNYLGLRIGVHVVRLPRGKRIHLQMWDIAPGDDVELTTVGYCRGALGAFICYEPLEGDNLEEVSQWVNVVRKGAGDIPIFLIECQTAPNHCQVPSITSIEATADRARQLGCHRVFMVPEHGSSAVRESLKAMAEALISCAERKN